MPVRPDDAKDLAGGVRDMYVRAESLILQKLARAVAKTGDTPDYLTAGLGEQRRMIRALDRILANLDNQIPGAVEDVVNLAYNRGVGFAVNDAEKAGITGNIFGRVQDTGSEIAIARAAIEPLGSMRFQIRRWTNDIYNQVTQQAAAEVVGGISTRRESSARMLMKLSGQGVKGFTDRSGRQWEAGAYAEMAVRSSASQASLAGHTERLQSYGVDTAIISDASEECEICRPWENQIVSISGSTSGKLSDGRYVKGSLADARSAGVFHPNCRHSLGVYLPGITTKKPANETRDPEGDKLRQQQRAYERRIRELKREKLVADEFGGPAQTTANRKLRAKQAEFKAFRDDNGRKTLTHRTNINAR